MPRARGYEQIMAIGKETTWGTGVSPTTVLPVTGGGITAQIEAVYDDGRRGVAALEFDVVEGNGHSEISIEGFVTADRIPWPVLGIFGADEISGAGDPYTHTFTSAINPPSFTIEDQVLSGSNGGMRAAGCKFGSLNFSFDAGSGGLTYSATAQGKLPSKVTPVNPALGTPDRIIGGWRAVTTGTGYTNRVISAEISITRELSVTHTATNTKDPYGIDPGPMSATITLTLATESLLDYDNYLASLRQGFGIEFQYGTPARGISFQMSDAFFGDQPLSFTRDNVVTNQLTLKGMYNATDAGVMTCAILNGVASAY